MSMFAITMVAVFVGTAALCAWLVMAMSNLRRADPLARLGKFHMQKPPETMSAQLIREDMLAEGLTGFWGFCRSLGLQPHTLQSWVRQAELPFSTHWLWISVGVSSVFLVIVAAITRLSWNVYPIAALIGGLVPFVYLTMRRRNRLNTFAQQLPDSLELLSSALRSGNTLQSGLQVIVEEMLPPISKEFGEVTEAVRLGIPVEQALDDLAERVPNPDLRFFVTAVAMQKQCGGDLAEILDKISWLVRERFYIQGQVKALTGEGRMSGAVLMALPLVMFLVLYALNYDYVMLLFNEPLGRKMLGGAIVLQVLGAIAIQRIIRIKI
jgi:tight adherence protein B